MKVVILCGGLGTRLREETEFKPKAMVEIGGRPILWHIMKHYAQYNFTEFVLCLGYKGNVIRDFFTNYEVRNRDVTITLGSHEIEVHNNHTESNWKITLAETGERTLTGGRLKRVGQYIDGPRFMATYGDGITDLNIQDLFAFHREKGKQATVTAVRPSSRFGELSIQNGTVMSFREKHQIDGGWINGGFFVFEREVLDQLGGDDESLEQGLLAGLTSSGQLAVYQHHGFWQCMDTHREMVLLNEYWENNEAPWAGWR